MIITIMLLKSSNSNKVTTEAIHCDKTVYNSPRLVNPQLSKAQDLNPRMWPNYPH